MSTAADLADILASALADQTAVLQEIRDRLSAPKLGLHDAAGPLRVYANRQHGGLWYRLDANLQPIIIHETALTGYLRSIEFPRVERRGKEVVKLQITIEGDRLYLVECGHDSHFSKGFLATVATLNPDQLKQPITLSPAPGQDESVLFCRVFVGQQLIKAPYDDETNWKLTAQAALSVVEAARF